MAQSFMKVVPEGTGEFVVENILVVLRYCMYMYIHHIYMYIPCMYMYIHCTYMYMQCMCMFEPDVVTAILRGYIGGISLYVLVDSCMIAFYIPMSKAVEASMQ